MKCKELPQGQGNETPLERARRAIRFILNPFVGRRDKPKTIYHLNKLEECVCQMREEGGDPGELFETLEEISSRNGGIPEHKGEAVAEVIKAIYHNEEE